MAPRFVGKTSLARLHPLQLDGRAALDLHARLREELLARAGADAATLFAEPVVTWPNGGGEGSVSWYSEAAGDALPLSALAPEMRALVEGRLRALLARIAPLTSDGELGPLLRRALALASPAGVLAVGAAPVLTEWGLSADADGSEEEQAARGSAWIAAYRDAPAPAPARPAAVAAAPVSPRPVPAAAPPTEGRPAWNWALIPAALVTAALFLGLGLWLGARLVATRVAERPTAVNLLDERATRDSIDRQREQNAALERDIEARRRSLAGNVCVADPAQMPRMGPDRAATVPPAAIVPPPGAQAFQGSLADLLKQAVVLIIAPGQGGAATGTGFFIAPDLIVTNRHVVEDADPAKIVVTNEKLGRVTRVEVVAQTPNSDVGSPDVALLRITGAAGIQPLAFSTTAAPLDQVIAAGFPGLLMQSDEAFERLRGGDASAVPQVILTDGRINAIQSAQSGMRIIPHSAAVSGGNSGGPLVDACGRVVGVNTFITANREQVAHANYAQKSDGVIEFVRSNGATVADLTGPCTPGAPAAPPAAAAPAAPTSPAAPAPPAAPAAAPR